MGCYIIHDVLYVRHSFGWENIGCYIILDILDARHNFRRYIINDINLKSSFDKLRQLER